MSMMRICFSSLCIWVVIIALNSCAFAVDVSHDGRALKIDGQRRIILSGAIHYPRSTTHMWPDLIKKAKGGGLDAIETYIFWNAHEPVRRQYDFNGNLDFIRFIKTVQNEGLYVFLRIGPYACAEWNYGGFPVWLHNLPGIQLRTANDVFMKEMQNFTTLIVDMVKQEKLFASQGGPIILAQIENEYGNIMGPYGAGGKAYINWCANMADSLSIGVPWIMCQQPDAPQPMINTCNGFYCHEFQPNNPNSPKMWTENWLGWFKAWGNKHPYRPAEDVAFGVARFFQNGGTFNNYYMYHGGTNFGRTSGGPYITTTYDYDAPLNEYGSLNQPKYGHLKELHDALHSIEKILTYGNISTIDFGNSVNGTVYSYNGNSSCFFSNENSTSDATIHYKGVDYKIPAWSVSILPDCKKEVYNTAKVNTQTSVMVKKSDNGENEPISLEWRWRPEELDTTVVYGKGHVSATQLLDQKVMNDVSDYLWYMTSVDLKKNDIMWSHNMSLRVNGTGHILHAYINGKYVGSKWGGYDSVDNVYETNVKLKHGKNQISLLSATVGLQNYGARFDLVRTGLAGPVEIIGRRGDDTLIKDLSTHKWWYQSGLRGFDDHLFKFKSTSTWRWDELPINRRMTWYKASFKAPLGEEPVVLDLIGLGKGMAWVNGHSLGRYWASYIAGKGNCSESEQPCDYRGKYSAEKCVSGCGKPSQRWYHVPRSFLVEEENEVVLFEEFGGNPTLAGFRREVVGSVCGTAYENRTMELSCSPGRTISAIGFAAFGDARGSCGSFRKGACTSQNDALPVVQECVGKEKCRIVAAESVFGSRDCEEGIWKRLVVEALC
ncbi:beta-galactosidase 15-like [Salvia miltiorrhiza]|uniref:beta-galactosidase 15-like n=1 Tax=Salvia miltiorrhiza TaxID=226208 RepID=UPI0025AC89AF|nr:beta-galactosidase 15-like [Salvia miltiorrhiza]